MVIATGSAPKVTAPATAAVAKNGTLTFSGSTLISVTDSNAGSTVERLAISVTEGTVALSTTTGITFVTGSSPSPAMSITGSLASLNAALNQLKYTPGLNFTGNASLILNYTDVGNGMTASATVAITVGPSKTGGGIGGAVVLGGTLGSANSPAPTSGGTTTSLSGSQPSNPGGSLSPSLGKTTAGTSSGGLTADSIQTTTQSTPGSGSGQAALADTAILWEALEGALSALSG
jgi:hypothetical protein